jgi:hypothetical protein
LIDWLAFWAWVLSVPLRPTICYQLSGALFLAKVPDSPHT